MFCFNRFVYLRVGGGLGNQLHQYAAALYYSEITSRKLIIDVRGLRELSHGNGSSILFFRLPGQFVDSFFVSSVAKLWRRLSGSRHFARMNLGVYVAKGLGYQAGILQSAKRISYLEGFFHTYVYFYALKEKGILNELELRNESKWYRDRKTELLKKKVCAIHYRLGDFESNWQSYGVLAKEYYLNLLDSLELHDYDEIWVFSNDLDGASRVFGGITKVPLVFMRPDSDSNDAESLLLMSGSDKLIMANSMFSWWAGILSKQECSVFVPTPFTRSGLVYEKLIPDSWFKYPAVWQDY